jgi:hypothetical protein
MWNSVDFDEKDFAQKKNVEIIQLPGDEIGKWKKAAEPVIENYVKEMISKGFAEPEIREWIRFLRERIEYWTAKQINYHIKSPTGPDEMQP